VNPGRFFVAIVRRELQIAFKRWSDLLSPLVFFVMVTTLFPLALSPQHAVLRNLGPAVLWIAALLATLLSLNALFRADVEDGSLEQLVIGPYPLPLAILGKTAAHWLLNGLPLVILAPVLAVTYYLPSDGVRALSLTLLLGTPTLGLFGPTDPVRFAPWGPRARALRAEGPCATCDRGAPRGDDSHTCLPGLGATAVCAAALELLESR